MLRIDRLCAVPAEGWDVVETSEGAVLHPKGAWGEHGVAGLMTGLLVNRAVPTEQPLDAQFICDYLAPYLATGEPDVEGVSTVAGFPALVANWTDGAMDVWSYFVVVGGGVFQECMLWCRPAAPEFPYSREAADTVLGQITSSESGSNNGPDRD